MSILSVFVLLQHSQLGVSCKHMDTISRFGGMQATNGRSQEVARAWTVVARWVDDHVL
jgi:hypothetical protein